MPRRTYRIKHGQGPTRVSEAAVDQGLVNRIERTDGPRGKRWLESDYVGAVHAKEPDDQRRGPAGDHRREGRDALREARGARRRVACSWSARRSRTGKSSSGGADLIVLGKRRQWMQFRVIDTSTGRPTPARVHFSGSHGEYLAPYGHHSQINANWFEDYGADVVAGGRNFAYVHGRVHVRHAGGRRVTSRSYKGFEYEPTRMKLKSPPRRQDARYPPCAGGPTYASKGWGNGRHARALHQPAHRVASKGRPRA